MEAAQVQAWDPCAHIVSLLICYLLSRRRKMRRSWGRTSSSGPREKGLPSYAPDGYSRRETWSAPGAEVVRSVRHFPLHHQGLLAQRLECQTYIYIHDAASLQTPTHPMFCWSQLQTKTGRAPSSPRAPLHHQRPTLGGMVAGSRASSGTRRMVDYSWPIQVVSR